MKSEHDVQFFCPINAAGLEMKTKGSWIDFFVYNKATQFSIKLILYVI